MSIEVRDLTRYYGPKVALQDVSFEAARGDILGLLGPNGAGKSTAMRILTGYLPPSSGTARIAGFDVMEHSLEVRRRLGYVPEYVPLYPDMTVGAYLDFVARAKAVAPRRASVAWAVDAARVAHVAGTIIGRLCPEETPPSGRRPGQGTDALADALPCSGSQAVPLRLVGGRPALVGGQGAKGRRPVQARPQSRNTALPDSCR